MIRLEAVFTGRVQGVGFRATTLMIARRFAVTGWVRNESDGSVRCVVEGERAEVDRFLAAVQAEMIGHIGETRVEPGPATGEFTGFSIAR